MLTPQDIQGKEFTKAVFGGYDMGAVDDFIDTVVADYSALYKEAAILKGKIKVLVDKVEEYRSTEDAMRMALLSAQKLGDDMVAESKQKSEALLAESKLKSESLLSESKRIADETIAKAEDIARAKTAELRKEIEVEEQRLLAARERTARFIEATRALLGEYSTVIDRLEELGIAPAAAPEFVAPAALEPEDITIPEPTEELDTASQIDAFVAKMLGEDLPAEDPAGDTLVFTPVIEEEDTSPTVVFTPISEEPEKAEEPVITPEDEEDFFSPKPKFDFSDLRFGTAFRGDDDDDDDE